MHFMAVIRVGKAKFRFSTSRLCCAADSEHTNDLKSKAREEWVALILRT